MDQNFMELDRYGPRDRLAGFLRSKYSTGHAAKRIAADLDCTPRAAENWLAGHWPGSRHWQNIVRRFGQDVLEAVFTPDIDETRARLLAEVRELEETLELKKASLRKAGGAMAGDPRGLAPYENRAAAVVSARALAMSEPGRAP